MRLLTFQIMKTAKEIYKDELDDDWFCICDYQPMIEEIAEVVVQVDDAGYQGDSRILYRNGKKVGYLNFGWGSCSGCDALQACSDIEEVQELFEGLVNDVKWFDSKKEALEYFKNKDWELEYSWHAEEQKEFLEKAMSYLES